MSQAALESGLCQASSIKIYSKRLRVVKREWDEEGLTGIGRERAGFDSSRKELGTCAVLEGVSQ